MAYFMETEKMTSLPIPRKSEIVWEFIPSEAILSTIQYIIKYNIINDLI